MDTLECDECTLEVPVASLTLSLGALRCAACAVGPLVTRLARL
jgi:hypothetical protein